MKKITQKQLKNLVATGAAVHVTAPEQIKEPFERVSVSRGVYGMNGALLKGAGGTLYAITARNSALFYYV